MDDYQIKEILSKYKVIAVVGLSKDPEKDSYMVSAYLQKHGFRIIPVNPFADEILGEKSYKSILDIPTEIQKTLEIINVFRPAKYALPIVKQAITLKKMFDKPFVVWMQLGIVNEAAAKVARASGIVVVMDKCLMVEYRRSV